MANRPFRCVWSMVGRWLIYVPDPEEPAREEQLSLPDYMKAEAHKLGAADALYEALLEARICAAADVEEASDRDGGRYHGFLQVFEDRLTMIDAALAKARGEA